MVTANLKFEVSGQSQHHQLTFDWLIDSVTGQSVNTTHARLIWLIDSSTFETQMVHPPIVYIQQQGGTPAYTKPYGTTDC
jgi:hypothetical protein